MIQRSNGLSNGRLIWPLALLPKHGSRRWKSAGGDLGNPNPTTAVGFKPGLKGCGAQECSPTATAPFACIRQRRPQEADPRVLPYSLGSYKWALSLREIMRERETVCFGERIINSSICFHVLLYSGSCTNKKEIRTVTSQINISEQLLCGRSRTNLWLQHIPL